MKNLLTFWMIALLTIGCASAQNKKDKDKATTQTETKKSTKTESKEINWMSIEEAVAAQKKNPKKIFLDAYTKWCGPCKMLDRNTFHNANVVKYVNEHYYAVKFDAEGPDPITFKGKTYTNPNYKPNKRGRNGVHELSSFFGVHAYPTMLFFDEEANIIMPATGYLKPQQLEIYLKLVAQDDYKKLKSKEEWEAYQKNFVPTF